MLHEKYPILNKYKTMALPTIENLLLETPLYEKFEISEHDAEYLFNLIYFIDRIDTFCPSCNRSSTFRGTNKRPNIGGWSTPTYQDFLHKVGGNISRWNNLVSDVKFVCTRDESHIMQFSIYFLDNEILKIGQYPSIADLSAPDLKKYREVLSKEKYKEFNRGIGLITHGVGVGAFVYLRRIFEDLIEEARNESSKLEDWDDSLYQRSRMDEKIELLKNKLPEFLVENRKLYGILSKGIHELTEDECLEYFATVKLGIELILDEKLEIKKRQDKIDLAKKSLGKIHSDLQRE